MGCGSRIVVRGPPMLASPRWPLRDPLPLPGLGFDLGLGFYSELVWQSRLIEMTPWDPIGCVVSLYGEGA